MKSQHSNQKSQYLDKLLNWYDNTKKQDDADIKKSKEDFIRQIKQFEKQQISNTVYYNPKGISLWKRLKKVLGIG